MSDEEGAVGLGDVPSVVDGVGMNGRPLSIRSDERGGCAGSERRVKTEVRVRRKKFWLA